MDNSPRRPMKTERACKPCRDLKVRCLPCAGMGNVCQKCQRSGAECIFEEPKQRKKRKAPDDRVTVEVLEAKLSELAKQLETSHTQRQVELNTEIHTFPSLHSISPKGQSGHAAQIASGPSSSNIPADNDSFDRDEHIIEQILRSGIISTDTAHSYLLKYRQMCSYSPFVVVSEEATIDSLRKGQPFLLHAILAVASRENRELQSMLGTSLRERLLKTVMIEGEKSIDLLQALLVYLTWEHFFYVPKKRNFDQMLQVAISMCVDMGLDHEPSEASTRRIGIYLEHHYSAGGSRDDKFFSKAARRVYIGCYYLSAKSTWVWRKRNNLQYTDYIMECARSLSENPEYETDVLILPLLQIQRLGDEFHDKFLFTNLDYFGPCSSERVQTHMRTFRAKINEVLLSGNLDSLPINLAAHSATTHTHEMDRITPGLSKKNRPSIPENWATSSLSQLDVLMVCLESAKAFVESFLSIPLAEYEKLSGSQWWGLICSIVVLYILSIGNPQLSDWNVGVARDKVRLDIYLDLLCYRMQSITSSSSEAPTGRDLFSLLGPIFANVKNTYERLKKLPQTSSSIDKEPAHSPTLFEEQATNPSNKTRNASYQSRCPAFPFWSSNQNFNNPAVEAQNDLIAHFESADSSTQVIMDSLLDDSSWLEDMPDLNLECNISDWDLNAA